MKTNLLDVFPYHAVRYHCLCDHRSKEVLEVVKKNFIVNFDSCNNSSGEFDQSFHSCLIKAHFLTKNNLSGCLKKVVATYE